MPYHAVLRRLSAPRDVQTLEKALLALGGFVLLDAALVHPFIWNNQPTLYYFAVKPLWVGVGLVFVAWWLIGRGVSRRAALLVGGVVGIVYLQLYYTVVPIPVVGGEVIQVGLFGNLTEGLIVHLGAFALSLAAVELLYSIDTLAGT